MKNKVSLKTFFTLMLSVILLGTVKEEVFAEAIPKVAIVSLDHSPFVQGDNNSFYISAKNYEGWKLKIINIVNDPGDGKLRIIHMN